MSNDTTEERLARLEERMQASNEDRREVWAKMDELISSQQDVTKELHKILIEMTNWKGKIGGVMLAAGCIWAFITIAWSSIVAYLKYSMGAAG